MAWEGIKRDNFYAEQQEAERRRHAAWLRDMERTQRDSEPIFRPQRDKESKPREERTSYRAPPKPLTPEQIEQQRRENELSEKIKIWGIGIAVALFGTLALVNKITGPKPVEKAASPVVSIMPKPGEPRVSGTGTNPAYTGPSQRPATPSAPDTATTAQQEKMFRAQMSAFHRHYPAALAVAEEQKNSLTTIVATKLAAAHQSAARSNATGNDATRDGLMIGVAPADRDGSVRSFICTQDYNGVTALVRATASPKNGNFEIAFREDFGGPRLIEEFSQAGDCRAAITMVMRQYGRPDEFSHRFFGR